MRYKRVLLVMPPLPNQYGAQASPPISIGYLSEFLTIHKIEHEILDMSFGYTLDDLKAKIKQFKPDLIGLTMFGFRRDIPSKLIEAIKSKDYDIIIGGPHPSTEGPRTLEEIDADYTLRLEGEEILLGLCNGTPLKDISGLIYRDGDKIIENPRGSFTDVTKIPFPKYEKFELDKYLRKKIRILTSRGCPYSCTFCSVKNTIGKKMRLRTPESVVEEVKFWTDKGYRDIDFIDDHLLFDKKRVIEFCEGIEKLNINDLNLSVGNGIRADGVDKEILTYMKRAGFKGLSMGVEASNNRMLKLIKKGETIEQIENAIKLATDMGFDVSLFFIVGQPHETEKEVRESFKLALKYPVNNVSFYNPVPFPGTELYEYVEKNNLFIVKAPDYLNTMAHFAGPIFVTPELSYKKRVELLEEGKKVEKEILRRSFVRKLKRFGILSEISSHIVFLRPVHRTLQRLSAESIIFKKTLIFITNKLNLKLIQSLR